MDRSVRMSDIAQRMGISTVSVSKALAGKPGVSEELRVKIVAVAQEMGYNGLRQRRTPGATGNIGILIPDRLFSGNFFYTELYRALVKKSGAAGYTCILELVSEQMEQEGIMPAFLTEQKADGMIFIGEVPPYYAEAVAATGPPCLTLDFHIPNSSINYVVRDNIGGGLALTEYLLNKGWRSIGFAGDLHSYHGMTRYLGYQWALRRAGIVPQDHWCLAHSWDADLADELPEAFVCVSENLAVHLTKALQKTGKRAAIVCFGDDQIHVSGMTEFVTYQIEVEQMAEIAIRQILCGIHRKNNSPLNCIVPGQLIQSQKINH